jgi:hypothetical protein
VFGDIVPLFEKYGFELYERFYHLVIPDLESTKIAEGEG